MILNDAKAKYKTKKSLLETLIDQCPMSDHVFDEIVEAYDSDEETAMDLMINCDTGKFSRTPTGGWEFEENED